MENIILEMRGISKEFPGVKALDNVSFNIIKGEIHALVGENGAGKSTLMKILSGVYPHGTYTGDIILNGKIAHFKNIKESEKSGIAIIYQELALVKHMNICENIFLGNEVHTKGIINWNKAFSQTETILKEVRMNIKPSTKIIDLGVGQQQLVEIAKAISKNCDILILDEPTSALTESETENLFIILNELKTKGKTCIFISHRLKEVFEISDRITVLRDGKTICTENTKDMDEEKLIAKMVGRELTNRYPRKKHKAGEAVMEIRNWTVYDPETEDIVNDNINFTVYKGEILGIAGLMGAGRTELAMSIFGAWGNLDPHNKILINNKVIKIHNTKDAIDNGISLLSEDRKKYGLVLIQDIRNNISLASLEKLSKFYIINQNEEIKESQKYITDIKIKTPSMEQAVGNLSGGNQQKVVIAKWLLTKPVILILDEPTRGIDVGAKYEIYNIMNELVDQGVCIIMISSELPEILGMSDRIIVMHEGKITGELSYEEATQEKIMYYAAGVNS